MNMQCTGCRLFYLDTYPHYCPATKTMIPAKQPQDESELKREIASLKERLEKLEGKDNERH